jgi:hypothetical protein
MQTHCCKPVICFSKQGKQSQTKHKHDYQLLSSWTVTENFVDLFERTRNTFSPKQKTYSVFPCLQTANTKHKHKHKHKLKQAMAMPQHDAEAINMMTRLVQLRKGILSESAEALGQQVSKPKPTTREGATNWQNAMDAAQNQWLEARKMLAQASTALAEEKAKSNGGLPSAYKFSKLPSPSVFPIFKPKLSTTRRDCTDFLEAYERMMETAIVPYQEGPHGHEQFRWLAAMHQSFAKIKRSHELLKWLKDHKIAKTSWPAFQAEFIKRFAKDETFTQAKKTLEQCKQQSHQDVGDFFDDFITYAQDADFGANEPPADWKQSNLLADKFLSKLKETLISKVIDNVGYEAVANDVVKLCNLAAKIERAQLAKSSVLAKMRATGVISSAGKKAQAPNATFLKSKRNDGYKRRDANTGANGAGTGKQPRGKDIFCSRCKRMHPGGATRCWAESRQDGSIINSPATANKPSWFIPGHLYKGKNSGSKRNAQAIESEDQQREAKKRKKIGRMLGGKSKTRSVQFQQHQDAADADDEFEFEYDDETDHAEQIAHRE